MWGQFQKLRKWRGYYALSPVRFIAPPPSVERHLIRAPVADEVLETATPANKKKTQKVLVKIPPKVRVGFSPLLHDSACIGTYMTQCFLVDS